MSRDQGRASYIRGGRTLSRAFTVAIGVLTLLRVLLGAVRVWSKVTSTDFTGCTVALGHARGRARTVTGFSDSGHWRLRHNP